jgi:hypothetical protein
MTVGRHELELLVPADAPPTSRYTTYYWTGELHRTKGMSAKALCPVRVIGHPDHVYWPEGPHSGSDGPGSGVSLDQETVNAGEAVSGRAPGAEKIEVGFVLDAPQEAEGEQKQHFEPVAETRPAGDGTFRLEIPAGVQPTLYNGDRTWITWEVRATSGTTSAWRRFAVLDPDGQSDVPDLKAGALVDLFTTQR